MYMFTSASFSNNVKAQISNFSPLFDTYTVYYLFSTNVNVKYTKSDIVCTKNIF